MKSIRRAVPCDHRSLTKISFCSKAYWQYPESYFSVWKSELTVTADYISRNEVFAYCLKEEIVAYYSLVMLSQEKVFSGEVLQCGWWLDHMFVLPENIGRGIGREMFGHCINRLLDLDAEKLMILADPFAWKFYEKMGCRCHGAYPSTIPGRTTPYLEYHLEF